MLITLCYSVLTWMQSRQRTEVISWIQECLIKEEGSLVLIRDRLPPSSSASSVIVSGSGSATPCTILDDSDSVVRSDSVCSSNFGESPSRNISRRSSSSTVYSSSNFSTPKRGEGSDLSSDGGSTICSVRTSDLLGFTSFMNKGLRKSQSFTGSMRQISELCYNHNSVKLRRLLWEEDRTRAIVLIPRQIVALNDWTSFRGTLVESGVKGNELQTRRFCILLEAEPGLVQRHHYRKFSQFGEIIAWKCGHELGLILQSDLNQLIELMHIFRLGQIILEGGWRIYRLTTITCEGSIGTLIQQIEGLAEKKSLTPGDLRRLSAGIYESREGQSSSQGVTSTPKSGLSKDTSKHDITTISEETIEELENGKKLPNWYERSPRKRSVATLPTLDRSAQATSRRRQSSFCPGALSSNRASSLASLLCSKSMSVDEEDLEDTFEINEQPTRLAAVPTSLLVSSSATSRSHDSLWKSSSGANTPIKSLLSPMSSISKPIGPGQGHSLSASSSPRRMLKKSPNKRIGKPPNILILCDSDKKREEIGKVLKSMLANDRYAIYDIRWDQLAVGGWSEQTALLVLSGKIPRPTDTSRLLQFLGDGGRLLAWCCEDPPFGLLNKAVGGDTTLNQSTSQIIQHGPTHRITKPLTLTTSLWGVARDSAPPPEFQRILETNDSEGYSRPMTVSVYGKVKGTNESVIVQLDGGALGGKAILSQIQFEKCVDNEDSLALLSLLLSQNLGIDCTQIKSPEYTKGYLLGDHRKVMDFLTATPSIVQQTDLTVEFTPRGEKGSLPSHLRFPVYSLECPQNFSTLEYFNNLETKELGRLVIYTDIITSTMNVVEGHPLKNGLVVIANRQTSGRGRGKNVWLSPEGCACFSIQMFVDMGSQVGRRISLLQHIAALSVILAVPNHEEINLSVKWPNDIYANEVKIGGVLVHSRLEGKKAVVNVGIGVNVSNNYPTVSLNSLLHPGFESIDTQELLLKKNKLKYLSKEKLIAKTLVQFEKLLELLEEDKVDEVLALYQQTWIHGNVQENVEQEDDRSVVTVEVSEGSFAECRISGIDEYGFLRVTELDSGNVFSVRPDGNSFDIANRLIAIKD